MSSPATNLSRSTTFELSTSSAFSSSAVKVRNWPRLYSYPLTTSRFSTSHSQRRLSCQVIGGRSENEKPRASTRARPTQLACRKRSLDALVRLRNIVNRGEITKPAADHAEIHALPGIGFVSQNTG